MVVLLVLNGEAARTGRRSPQSLHSIDSLTSVSKPSIVRSREKGEREIAMSIIVLVAVMPLLSQ
jgi:hypothetical protein